MERLEQCILESAMIKARAAVPGQVRVLQKTLDILESIKGDGAGMGLADVARSVSMPKATVYRILSTLEMRGYLDRRLDGGYRMSDKFFALQREASPAQNLPRVAPPIMEALAAECRETVNLGTLDGGEVVMIATAESPQSVRMASKVGNRRCAHTTAIGKCLLAAMSDDRMQRLVQMKGLARLTPHSLTSEAALLTEIRRIRKQGYAIDNQENELEGRCIAVRIDGIPDIEVALSISGPVFRMDLRRLRSLLPLLRKASHEVMRASCG
jgi:DNA-binding IclR family transcriptional regulator